MAKYTKQQIQRVAGIQKEQGMKRMRGGEREGLVRLLMSHQLMTEAEKEISGRIGDVPNGNRRMHTAQKYIDNLCTEVLRNVPVDQLNGLQHDLRNATYKVGWYRPISSQDDWGIWLSFRQAEVVFSAITDHCEMCSLDVQQQQKCKLRKCLNSLPNKKTETYDEDGKQCPYFYI